MNRTRNEALVYEFLEAHGKPASAYGILDALRQDGLKAPLQVYRALTKLIESGAVHRIESLNAFVACRHHHCANSPVSIFMLFNACDDVTEAIDDAAASMLDQICATRGFTGARRVIEISGTCTACSGSAH